MSDLTKTQKMITEECSQLADLLILKNKRYGDSALSPTRIFSKASSIEQILVRIDDKLSRLQSVGMTFAEGDESAEDTVNDLMGYLVLLKVAMRKSKEPDDNPLPRFGNTIL